MLVVIIMIAGTVFGGLVKEAVPYYAERVPFIDSLVNPKPSPETTQRVKEQAALAAEQNRQNAETAAKDEVIQAAVEKIQGTWLDKSGNGFVLSGYHSGSGRYQLVGKPLDGFLAVDGVTQLWSLDESDGALKCSFNAIGPGYNDAHYTDVLSASGVVLDVDKNKMRMVVGASSNSQGAVLRDGEFTLIRK